MKPKLVVKMARDGRVLVMWVAYMDDSLRGKVVLARDADGYVVESVTDPELDDCKLFVQGSCRANDARVRAYTYASTEAAYNALGHFRALVAGINARDEQQDVPLAEPDMETLT